MTSANLNASEKSLLQYWLADQAPGYTKVVINQQNQMQRAVLQASDYTAIGALDNDTIRGYLAAYKTQKLANLATSQTQAAAQVTKAQALATNLATEATALTGLVVQTVPTTA